jgi:predicted lipoprotein with Yx(FWY)xxD motif
MQRLKITLGAAMILLLAGTAGAAETLPAGVQAQKSATGTAMLTDSKGMTLYTFDMDKEPGKSACKGQCATYWPALTASADAKPMGDWTIATHDDGTKQWAYKGKPLYTFMMDKKAGDTAGSEMGQNGSHVWHIATP